jgi:hypothetical protein
MTTFMITFFGFGLAFVPFILLFLIGGVDLKHKLGGASAILIFWLLVSVGMTCDSEGKKSAWNGGYCECGQHWELEAVAKSRHGNTTKYYVCPNCYAEITQ